MVWVHVKDFKNPTHNKIKHNVKMKQELRA